MRCSVISLIILLALPPLIHAEKNVRVTGYVFQEDTTGTQSPVPDLLVKLSRAGEENTTTSDGYFEIKTSIDGYVGEKIIFHIEREGWIVKIPANGEYIMPKFPDVIKKDIVLVRRGDKSLLNHAQIMAFLYDEVARLSKVKVEFRDTELTKLVREYSRRLKLEEEALNHAIEDWIKNAKTHEEKALAAFHKRDYEETINQANKVLRESVNIRKLKADALFAKLDYLTALEEFNIILHDAPSHAGAINSIGGIYMVLAKHDQAVEHFDVFLSNRVFPLYYALI